MQRIWFYCTTDLLSKKHPMAKEIFHCAIIVPFHPRDRSKKQEKKLMPESGMSFFRRIMSKRGELLIIQERNFIVIQSVCPEYVQAHRLAVDGVGYNCLGFGA